MKKTNQQQMDEREKKLLIFVSIWIENVRRIINVNLFTKDDEKKTRVHTHQSPFMLNEKAHGQHKAEIGADLKLFHSRRLSFSEQVRKKTTRVKRDHYEWHN